MTKWPAFEGRKEHALGRDAQIHDFDSAHGRIGIENESKFSAPHGGRDVRLHGTTMDFPCVGIETRGDIDGHAQGLGRIHASDGGRRRTLDLRAQPRAEDRVDNDLRAG